MSQILAHKEHVELVATGNVAATDPDRFIAGSWRRCLNKYNLNPDSVPTAQVLESHHLKEHVQRHDYLLGVAQQELVDLYNQMQGSGYSIFLTDAEGIVLQQVCDLSYVHSMRKAGLLVGANWSEQASGTNGIGTCIIEQRPITVHLDDHFHTDHTQLSCSAAPIRDPSGELLAVLDSSAARSANPRADKQTLGLVRNTASFIEGLYFLRLHRGDIIIHLGGTPDLVPQPRNPMIAITSNGRITGANERALLVLGTPSRQALFGREIHHVFDLRDCPINSASSGQIQHLRILDRGTHVFATWQAGSPKNSHTIDGATLAKKSYAIAATPPPARALGHSALVDEVETAAELLDQNMAVLLQGETGTGKDTIARSLHDASQFKNGPFVAIDCCSASPEMLRCISLREPSVEEAEYCPLGGTLFLNNINLMPESQQAQLVEQMHLLERASATQPTEFNIIAACRGDLRSLVADEHFREDLFYRLAQYLLEIPALRDREQRDSLLQEILASECARQGKALTLDEAARPRLLDYSWPGNIRELTSVMRTAVTLCKESQITDACLPVTLVHAPCQSTKQTAKDCANSADWSDLEAAEYEVLLRELRKSRWNISATAKKLNMSRNTIYRKMEKYAISPDMDTNH